jgi:hypothetical protein
LVQADLTNANLTGCRIYGVSAWGLKVEGAKQQDLIITNDVPEVTLDQFEPKSPEPEVTVDNIEVAQFVYLLLYNERIRDAINTIGNKGVLLLGRFTGGRMAILNQLRDELRNRGFLPMVFNFERPEAKDFTETVRTLVGLSRFVIADITNPIIEQGEEPFAMFKDLWVKHREWVLEPISYSSMEELAQGLDEGIIGPALVRSDELVKKKAEEMPVRRMGDIIKDMAHKSR